MVWWIVGGIAVIIVAFVAWALCRMSAIADQYQVHE